jgi:hypothetical protein
VSAASVAWHCLSLFVTPTFDHDAHHDFTATATDTKTAATLPAAAVLVPTRGLFLTTSSSSPNAPGVCELHVSLSFLHYHGVSPLHNQSEFKTKRLDCALQLYERALKFAPDAEARGVILCNLSVVAAGMGRGDQALGFADDGVALDANNAKAHFRRGQVSTLAHTRSHSRCAAVSLCWVRHLTWMAVRGGNDCMPD